MAKSKQTKQPVVKSDYDLLVEQGMHVNSQSTRHCSEQNKLMVTLDGSTCAVCSSVDDIIQTAKNHDRAWYFDGNTVQLLPKV